MPAAPLRLDRVLLPVSGPDAEAFLQNLITQDIALLAHAPALYAGLLTPQGKVFADFVLWRREGGFGIDVAVARAAGLRQKLMMYRLRANVTIGPAEEGLGIYADSEGVEDPRLPALPRRRLAPADGPPPEAEPEAYRRARLAAGAPDLVADAAPEEVFALEALFEELNGAGFQKGCFVGQENVSRMKRRATTRRKFCPVAFEGPAPAFGAAVTAGPAELGEIRTGMAGRALALLRVDRAQEAITAGIALTAEGRPVRLAPPPWLLLPGGEREA